MVAAEGNSRRLLRTCVMAAAVGFPSATPPPTARIRVAPSTDATSTTAAPAAHVAAHTSRSRKSCAAHSAASTVEKKKNGAREQQGC